MFFRGNFTIVLTCNSKIMQELIDQLKSEVGLTQEQAVKAIMLMKEFAKDKFPLFSGAIEKVFTKYAPKEGEDFLD